MAKIIKTNEQTVLMEISKTELNVYANSFLNQLNDEPIESSNDQALVLMAMAGLEAIIPHCAKEIKTYYNETLKEVSEIEWEDVQNEEENQEESISEDITFDDGQEYSDAEDEAT